MRILIAAVLCAVICVTAIAFSIDAIRNRLNATSTIMLGGDRVLSSSDPIEPEIKQIIAQSKLAYSETISFYSMLSNQQELLLASVKAVDGNYPLLGDIKISSALNTAAYINNHAPPSGEIWLEPRAILQLGAKVGDKIQVGDTQLVITAVLVAEPDRLADGFTFAPRAMMNLQDVAKTKSIVVGSRANYKTLITGDKAHLSAFDLAISKLPAKNYNVKTIADTSDRERNLDLAYNYLNLAMLINMLLAAITVIVAANRYSTVHTIDAAILRCLGATKQQILYIYGSNLVIVSLLIGIVGSVIGFCIELGIAYFLQTAINLELASPGYWPLILGIVTSLFLVVLFAMPAIVSLANTAPIKILHRANRTTKHTTWRIHFNLSNKIPALLRLSLNNIAYNSQHNLLQVTTFALIICVGTVLYIIRNDLLQSWTTQIPKNVPNYFAINIPSEQKTEYEQYLKINHINSSEFYPLVRGELVKINNEPVTITENNNSRQGINRPLNLTWTTNLPYENKVLKGQWFSKNQYGKALISIENEMANRLKVRLGDSLTFRIMGDEITADISSIRSVAWGSFTPNFYVIYNPGLLNDLPVTYMSSFYMSPIQEALLLDMVKRFPQINLINVTTMLDTAQMVISLLSLVIAFIWTFTLTIGILLLLAILLAGMNLRVYQNSLMRIFGATRRQLLSIFVLEYALLGAIAGLIGSLIAIITAQQLSMRYFSLYYPLHWKLVFWAILTGIIIMLVGGLLGSRKIFNTPPIETLRGLD